MPALVVTALSFIGVTGTVATVAANIAVLAATAAINMGISSYQQRMARKKARKSYVAPTTSVKGGSEPRRRSLGRVGKLGGFLAFAENINDDSVLVLVYNHGTIASFDEIYVGDRQVTLADDGQVATPPIWHGGNGTNNVRSYMAIEPHRGYADQTASTMVRGGFAQWTEDHKLNGCAYLAVHFSAVPQEKFQDIYQGTLPDVTVVASTSLVFDPRNPAHDISDPDTWEFSENAALLILDYLIHVDGMAVSHNAVDLASFSRAADICDELVPLKSGGQERRYRAAATYTFDDQPAEILERLADTCGAEFFTTAEGNIGVVVAEPMSPTVTISDDDIVSLDLERGNGLLTQYNTVVPRYVEPSLGWQFVDAAAQYDPAAVNELGRQVREQTDLYYVTSHTQAQRLARRELYLNNPRYTGEMVCHMSALRLRGHRVFRLQSETYGLDLVCRVTSLPEVGSEATVTVKWEAPDPEIDLWNPEIHEGDGPVIPDPTTDDPSMPGPPTGLSFSFETASGITTAGARWASPVRTGQTFTMRYRKFGDTSWVTTAGIAAMAAVVAAVDVGDVYEFGVRVHTAQGGISSWADAQFTPATTAAPAVAPPVITSVEGLVEQARVTITQSASAGAWALQWVATPSGGSVSWASPNISYPAPGTSVVETISLTPGDYSISARSVSLSGGTISSIAGPVIVTVNEPEETTGGTGSPGDGGVGGAGTGTAGGAVGDNAGPGGVNSESGTGLW